MFSPLLRASCLFTPKKVEVEAAPGASFVTEPPRPGWGRAERECALHQRGVTHSVGKICVGYFKSVINIRNFIFVVFNPSHL